MAIPAPGRFDAEKIRAARKELGMTQVELAERIGVAPTVVNDWEKRGTRPSVRVFTRLASAVGLSVADFYQPDRDTVGTLSELRVAAGLSQRELATQLGLSQTTVSRWERALARPTWDEITSYANALDTDRIAIADAIDLTATQRGSRPTRRRLKPADFHLVKSSPHIVYEFEDDGGHVDVFSPQFPRLTFRTTFAAPLMRELAVINEYVRADYFHRYNHLQRRCGDSMGDGAVYLIRWLSAYHETTDPESHSRVRTAGRLLDSTSVWRAGLQPGPSSTLPTGEYLIIVVEPQDTVEFLFGQLSDDMPVTFYPTRMDSGIGPLAIQLDDRSDGPAGWRGAFRRGDIPADMTFSGLFHHVQSIDPRAQTISAPSPGAPQSDIVRSIHRRFSRTTPHQLADT